MVIKPGELMVVVSTKARTDEIVAAGGIGNWVLNPDKGSKCKYVVCCRKEDWRNRKEGIPARTAFLVGTISEFRRMPESENARGQSRFFIGISSYALVRIKNVWKAGRNPVTYATSAELKIDIGGLRFKPVAKIGNETAEKRPKTVSQAIALAKRSLADSLNISVDDIEITIRG